MELTLRALALVSLGGAFGAPFRFALSVLVTRHLSQPHFPYATLLVNILGSFVLALLTWMAAGRFGRSSTTRLLLGTGLMGAFTTFSTFSVETVLLVNQSRHLTAAVYVLSSIVLCILAAYAGMQIARFIA
ncbi:fluoride efflux transporter CrcB [soil metagenome]